MPKKFFTEEKIQKYIVYVTGLTLLAFVISVRFKQVSDFIINFHTSILVVALFILLIALVLQRKQNTILQENEQLYRALQEKQKMIDRDMNMARKIQQAILNEPLPEIKGLKIAAKCLPAEKIGGDFFNIHKLNNELHFFVGDVSGHGISSALVMSLTHGIMNEIVSYIESPAQILTMTNKVLSHYLEGSINFVTIFYGRIDLTKKELTYCSAGHPPAFLFKKGQMEPELLPANGVIMGIFNNNNYQNAIVKLASKDKLVIYTDGFIESKDKKDQELGEKGFAEMIASHLKLSPEKMNELLYRETAKRAAEIKDDLSSIIIEVL